MLSTIRRTYMELAYGHVLMYVIPDATVIGRRFQVTIRDIPRAGVCRASGVIVVPGHRQGQGAEEVGIAPVRREEAIMLPHRACSQRMAQGGVSSRPDACAHPGRHRRRRKMCSGAAWPADVRTGVGVRADHTGSQNATRKDKKKVIARNYISRQTQLYTWARRAKMYIAGPGPARRRGLGVTGRRSGAGSVNRTEHRISGSLRPSASVHYVTKEQIRSVQTLIMISNFPGTSRDQGSSGIHD